MKIREYILEKELKIQQERLEKLKVINAPAIMITKTAEFVENISKGDINVGGDNALLDLEFVDYTVKKGHGGKVFIEFDNGVRYFPQARYGRFITK